MDINRKKIIIIDLEVLTSTSSGGEAEDITDFRIRKDILDHINNLRNIVRVVIVNHGTDNLAQVKAVEFFVFTYCNIAVSTQYQENLVEELMASLPHNQRKKELILKVGGERIDEIDYLSEL